jgi:hypothetical protein
MHESESGPLLANACNAICPQPTKADTQGARAEHVGSARTGIHAHFAMIPRARNRRYRLTATMKLGAFS